MYMYRCKYIHVHVLHSEGYIHVQEAIMRAERVSHTLPVHVQHGHAALHRRMRHVALHVAYTCTVWWMYKDTYSSTMGRIVQSKSIVWVNLVQWGILDQSLSPGCNQLLFHYPELPGKTYIHVYNAGGPRSLLLFHYSELPGNICPFTRTSPFTMQMTLLHTYQHCNVMRCAVRHGKTRLHKV